MARSLRSVPLYCLAAAGFSIIVLPVVGLLQRVAWSHFIADVRADDAVMTLQVSLECSLGALGVSCLVGLPLAWVLARRSFPGRDVFRSIVTLPMVLPPVVGGMALLYAFGIHGIFGRALYQWTGWRLPFTTGGAILAQTFVAMPFLVITAETAFRSFDAKLDEAAASLGASPFYRLRRVVLPGVLPAIGAGAALCWARALGEFGATITFAGNLPGVTQTVPLAIYLDVASGQNNTAAALSVVLVVVSLVVLIGLRNRWLLRP
jgi:molybdate transport system permease protein